MIRLLVAVVICLALHPAAPSPTRARERTIVVSGGEHATPRLGDAQAGVATLARVPSLRVPAPDGAAQVAPGSHRHIARLWLRAQRLLC